MKKTTSRIHAIFGMFILSTALLSCDSFKSSDYFRVGGTVSGLDGTLVLQNNLTDDLTITEDGEFTFDQNVVEGQDYSVTVLEQPTGLTCTVTNATGEVEDNSITDIQVDCIPPSPITKIIFITAATTDGIIGGVAGADALCMADASKPNASTYKALINSTAVAGTRLGCTSTAYCTDTAENVDWVMTPNTQYTRADGTTPIGITNSGGVFDLSSATLTNSYDGGPQAYFWVGVMPDWIFYNDCSGWTDNSTMVISGSFGASDAVDAAAIATFFTTCDMPLHLACVEQ